MVEHLQLHKSYLVTMSGFREEITHLQGQAAVKRRATVDLQRAKANERRDNKRVWRALEAKLALEPTILLKILPVGAYQRAEENRAWPYFIQYFQEAKSKYIKAKVLHGFNRPFPHTPDFPDLYWDNLWFDVELQQDTRYEALEEPLRANDMPTKWQTLRMTKGWRLTMNFRPVARRDDVMWKPRGYEFRCLLNDRTAVVTWDGKWWLISFMVREHVDLEDLVNIIGGYYVENGILMC
jgi:hypothetical protein